MHNAQCTMHNRVYVRKASSLFTGNFCPQLAPLGLSHLCIFNMRLIFKQSRRFVLTKIQYTRILSRCYNGIKIFLNIRRTNFCEKFQNKDRLSLQAANSRVLLSPVFVHNRYILCHLDYSVVIIFVLVFTIRNYTLTWILQKSQTFSRATNMHVNSIHTQRTVHKHLKFSGGTDENFV
jgi:hypothetical protein